MGRYRSYESCYKTTRKEYHNTAGEKFCLALIEISKGVTIESKRDLLCPYYERMDLLFGSRQNVNPSYVAHAGDDDTSLIDNYGQSDVEIVFFSKS